MRGRMGEVDTIRGVWLAALAIFGRYPLATLVPAAILGAIGEVPAYLLDGQPVLDQALTLVTAYVAYYLYRHTPRGSSGGHNGESNAPACRACSTISWRPRPSSRASSWPR
jgi:hypothetical protein